MAKIGQFITDPKAGAYCRITLDTGEKIALSFLTRDAQVRTLDATPLGAFVKYLKTCQSVDEVKARCATLMARHRPTEA